MDAKHQVLSDIMNERFRNIVTLIGNHIKIAYRVQKMNDKQKNSAATTINRLISSNDTGMVPNHKSSIY